MEGLSDDHNSKPRCLFNLSQLLDSLGNFGEQKQLLTRALELERGRGNDDRVACTLMRLANANRMLNRYKEGIQRAKEALEICGRLHDAEGQAKCWDSLGWLLLGDGQLDAAEEGGSRAIKLFLDQGREYWVCRSHRLLGNIYLAKGERGKAIHHFEEAIGIASPFDWHQQLFWVHYALTELYLGEQNPDDAQSHVQKARSNAVGDAFKLGRTMDLQAQVLYQQGRLEEGKAEILCAIESFEKLGATAELPGSRAILRNIERAIERR